jgi:solute:Na+ symporter, SSS family
MSAHWIDILVFVIYLSAMLGVGLYFFRKNTSKDDYFVGSRNMGPVHIGLSVVATDVGGGFSIGLGGLGFAMGISGSWMLFTGLLGAWLAAVFLIPKVYPLGVAKKFLSFPDLLVHKYNLKVGLVAGVISFIGYIGFSSSQILAGAKLASASFPAVSSNQAVIVMGVIAVIYTVMGGIKAVIYTDTIQWILLLAGIVFIGLPLAYQAIGGMEGMRSTLPTEYFSFTNISVATLFNWLITIVPIWFVGMTLYQRIYACRDIRTAKKAWYLAGVFEWPVMAFMGVLLGMFSKVGLDQGLFEYLGYEAYDVIDPEYGLPLLLRTILPIGLMGLFMSAYFSAILSTADSCLMAASGNFISDILGRAGISIKNEIKLSQISTLVIGAISILIALQMESVLNLMLYSYAFMVSGMFVPVLAILTLKRPSSKAALWAMITGGLTTLSLIVAGNELIWGLDANFFGISASFLIYLSIYKTELKWTEIK